jgi:ATP-dependent RNA helicase RhlE
MPFSTLGLSPVLCTPLARLGYTTPTPVQAASIPLVLKGRDLLARAQTGTGKTAAFGLPMIDRLLVRSRRPAGSGRPRGLVLVPTRELAIQVHTSLTAYGAPVGLRAVAIFGGVPIRAQMQALRRGTDVVVATPGRLIDHLQQRSVDLSGVEMLTLDEADRMLDMGFLPQLKRVLAVVPRDRQTLLLSATLSDEIVRLSAAFTKSPERVDVSEAQSVPTTVSHRVHPVADGRKGELLRHVLTQAPTGQALVFCKTKRGSNRVGEALDRAGVRSAVIHGNKSQGARNRALGDFKAGRVSVLVATDLAARGLDIAQLPLVVNYDLPLVAEDYVHRVGRTGRAGLTGRAVSLVSSAERGLLRDIQKLLPLPLEQVIVAGFEVSAFDQAAPVELAGRGRPGRPGHRFGRGGQGGSRPGQPSAARRYARPARPQWRP